MPNESPSLRRMFPLNVLEDAFGNIRLENTFEGVENRDQFQYEYSPFGVVISGTSDLAGDNVFGVTGL